MEEYSLAKQFFRLSSGDLCELARNSVLQSGFPLADKAHWLGSADPQHNEILKTNLPNARFNYRHECHAEEMQLVLQDDAGDAMTAYCQGIPRTRSREDLSEAMTPSPAPKRSKKIDLVAAVSNGVRGQEPHLPPPAPCPAPLAAVGAVGERLLKAVSSNPRTPLLDTGPISSVFLRMPGVTPEAAEEMELENLSLPPMSPPVPPASPVFPPPSPAFPHASQEMPPPSPSHSPRVSAKSIADPADPEAVLAALTGQ